MKKDKSKKYITQTIFTKEVHGLHDKIDSSVALLHDKIDSSVTLLHDKIDSSVSRLDKKIDTLGQRLDDKVNGIAIELVNFKHDFYQWKDTVPTTVHFDQLINRIDSYRQEVGVYRLKAMTHDHRLNELEVQVTDHEKRIVNLEPPESPPAA